MGELTKKNDEFSNQNRDLTNNKNKNKKNKWSNQTNDV